MSVLKIIKYNDKILRVPTKEVQKFSAKIHKLIDDMFDTMYANNGVGLAATQVGESYKIFVLDTSTGDEPLNPRVFVNPKIIKKSGAMVSYEGCLSFPDFYINVRRYTDVAVKAKNRNGRSFVLEAKGGILLAKALQHESDHLNGILFIDHSINRFLADEELARNNLPPIDPEYLLEEPELDSQIQEQSDIHHLS